MTDHKAGDYNNKIIILALFPCSSLGPKIEINLLSALWNVKQNICISASLENDDIIIKVMIN